MNTEYEYSVRTFTTELPHWKRVPMEGWEPVMALPNVSGQGVHATRVLCRKAVVAPTAPPPSAQGDVSWASSVAIGKAYFAGVAAGESGVGVELCHYGNTRLRDAWHTGHSRGTRNRAEAQKEQATPVPTPEIAVEPAINLITCQICRHQFKRPVGEAEARCPVCSARSGAIPEYLEATEEENLQAVKLVNKLVQQGRIEMLVDGYTFAGLRPEKYLTLRPKTQPQPDAALKESKP